jgi:cytochrome P450
MAFYGDKLRSVLNKVIFAENQTKTGSRLGVKFVVTCNPDIIQEIHTDKKFTRSAMSRRMVEHNGATDSLVAQDLDRARVKRPELKQFMNNDTYSNVLVTTMNRLENLLEENKNSHCDLYALIRGSLHHGFMEDLLGIEYSDELRAQISEIGFHKATYEETFEKLWIMNVVKLPMWLKNILSPVLKEKNRLFQETVEVIYNTATVKPHGWFARLLELEQNGTLSHEEVLGELRGIFISANTLAISLVWSIYRLGTDHPYHIYELKQREEYARYCYMESLRLHPPFPVVSYEKENKCPFHRNDIYIVSVFNTHRNPAYWDDAEAFKPNRFESGMHKIKKGSYIPFGGNERVCPGIAMSMSIAPKILRAIFTKYKFSNVTMPIVKHRGELIMDNNTFYVTILDK